MLPECNNGADNNPARNGWAKSNINLWEVKFATVKTNKSVFQAEVEKIKVFSPFLYTIISLYKVRRFAPPSPDLVYIFTCFQEP